MYWGDASAIPVADFDSPHACVNWEALVSWQQERRFDPKKPGYLRHPTLGKSDSFLSRFDIANIL